MKEGGIDMKRILLLLKSDILYGFAAFADEDSVS